MDTLRDQILRSTKKSRVSSQRHFIEIVVSKIEDVAEELDRDRFDAQACHDKLVWIVNQLRGSSHA